MNVLTKAAVIALTFSFSATGAQALGLREGAQPAETPPSSYTASMYVDSRGCVYIRAGYGGTVTWVPQVTRSRQVVCGARPSLAGAATAQAPAAAPTPAPAPAPTPTRAPAPAVAAAPAPTSAPAAAPAPTPSTAITRTVSLTCPAGGANKQVRSNGLNIPLRCEADQTGTISYIVRHANGERTKVIVNPPVRVASAPAAVAPPVSAPAPTVSTRVVTTGTSACPGRTGVSAAYTNASGVRCGPQGTPATVRSTGGTPPSTTGIITAARTTTQGVAPPPGYRAAWEDDRLNPNRGPRTAQGNAQMDLLWSQTVPRYLYDVNTGRDVTGLFAWLRYPNLPTQAQIRRVTTTSAVVSSSSAPVAATAHARAPAPSQPVATAPAAPAAAASHRFVQVGMFGVPANAQTTAQRLQRMGLPVKIGKLTRNGKAMQIVVAGPFTRQADLDAALAKVRAAGFTDAYLRK